MMRSTSGGLIFHFSRSSVIDASASSLSDYPTDRLLNVFHGGSYLLKVVNLYYFRTLRGLNFGLGEESISSLAS